LPIEKTINRKMARKDQKRKIENQNEKTLQRKEADLALKQDSLNFV